MNVVPIHAANPGPFTGDGNWTYLIPGSHAVLIDAGVGHATHLDSLASAVPAGPADVLVTHAHSDHAAGAPAMRARWPEARFAKYPWPERDSRSDIPWRALDDGAVVATGEGLLQAVHTPGHSPDHLSFWHASSRTIFVGDLLISGGTVFIPASRGGNLVAYLESLRRVAALQPLRALPAHGRAIEDPIRLITHYLHHRRQREEQVLTALDAGADTVESITDRIYVGRASAVMPMARESVLAHLHKLDHDGRVHRANGRWTLNREGT